MTCIVRTALALAVALAVSLVPLFAETADAKPRKQRVAKAKVAAVQPARQRADVFMRGPVYSGIDYMGDDPDPFIRLQIKRDHGARYGGTD